MATVMEKAEADQDSLTSIGEFSAQASVKVQLDIDDAPFLVDDEPPLPVATPAQTLATTSPTAQVDDADGELAKKRRKRKIIIFSGLGAISIALIAVLIWFFFLAPAKPEVATAQGQATIVVVPSPNKLAGPAELLIKFEPFLIPQKDDDKSKFLRMIFSALTLDEKLAKELQDKSLVLRDAIYYYLRNKPHSFLLDAENLPQIKQDLLDIINNYITAGKLEELLIENYLIK